MSKSALSVAVFAGYLLLLGLAMVLGPNVLLQASRMAPTGEVWIRVVGMLVLLLAFYYWNAARTELTSFFRWTVVARSAVPLFFLAFVAAGLAAPVLILFGVVDLVGALWTAFALRRDARPKVA